LQQQEAALGVIAFAKKSLNIKIEDSWYQKILKTYGDDGIIKDKLPPTLDDLSNLKSQLEALKATSSWEDLSDTLSKAWDKE